MASAEDPSLSLEEKADVPEGTITLLSQDGQAFSDLDKKHVFVSELVRNALATDPTAESIRIPGVGAVALGKLVDYLQHHKGHKPDAIAAPLRGTGLSAATNEFDAKFIAECVSEKLVFDVIYAAHFMMIPRLLDLGLAKVASLLKERLLHELPDVLTSMTGGTGPTRGCG